MITLSAATVCLALVVYHEARGEPPLVQLAVASTVRNRAYENGTTLCDEAMRPRQYHVPYQPDDDDPAWWAAQTLAYNAIRFDAVDPTGGALHFTDVTEPSPAWSAGMTGYRLGRVIFWRAP